MNLLIYHSFMTQEELSLHIADYEGFVDRRKPWQPRVDPLQLSIADGEGMYDRRPEAEHNDNDVLTRRLRVPSTSESASLFVGQQNVHEVLNSGTEGNLTEMQQGTPNFTQGFEGTNTCIQNS